MKRIPLSQLAKTELKKPFSAYKQSSHLQKLNIIQFLKKKNNFYNLRQKIPSSENAAKRNISVKTNLSVRCKFLFDQFEYCNFRKTCGILWEKVEVLTFNNFKGLA